MEDQIKENNVSNSKSDAEPGLVKMESSSNKKEKEVIKPRPFLQKSKDESSIIKFDHEKPLSKSSEFSLVFGQSISNSSSDSESLSSKKESESGEKGFQKKRAKS